ncbi:MAG: hypothetical protein IH965_00960 [Gemmatimonadetes bacterium]|nr:hypothetical protein [Gemmatimonadota bacterium]
MTYALMSSGGKDCTLAFDRARRDGYDVRYLANIYEGTTDRVRFHGVRKELVSAQAEAMGLEPILRHTTPHDFEPVLVELLDELKRRGCRGVIFGNIHLADVRAWYEERVTRSGLEHVELLWGEPPMELVYEVVERGYHGLLVSVDLAAPAARFLGRELDADLLTDIGITDDLDPCGERGEFHTFIYDGPEFRHAVAFDRGETLEIEGHRFIDLLPLQAR